MQQYMDHGHISWLQIKYKKHHKVLLEGLGEQVGLSFIHLSLITNYVRIRKTFNNEVTHS